MDHINDEGYEIKENIFQRYGVYVSYPTIVSKSNNKKVDVWNNIILQDIGSILKIYSDYTLNQTPKGEDLYLPDTLRITYDIKSNDNRYLSISYKADFFSPYAAYPTQMIYTTNIDKDNDRRLKLSDFISNQRFQLNDTNLWEIVSSYDDIKDYPEAVREYIKGLGKEILHMGVMSADLIGADNYLGIYSYLTPDRLGISISVPHYLGDHAEYEMTIPLSLISHLKDIQ